MGVVGWLFGLGRAVTVRVSFLLAQGGEFGFVLFGSARALGADDASFVTGIGVISVSMLVTPLLARLGEAIARRWERAPAAATAHLKVPLPAARRRGSSSAATAGWVTRAAVFPAAAYRFSQSTWTRPASLAAKPTAFQRSRDIGDPELLAAPVPDARNWWC